MGSPLFDALLPVAGGVVVKALDWALDAYRRSRDREAAELRALPKANSARLGRIEDQLGDVRERVAGIEGILHGILDRVEAPRPPGPDRRRLWDR